NFRHRIMMAASVIVLDVVNAAPTCVERTPFVGLNLWSRPRFFSLCRLLPDVEIILVRLRWRFVLKWVSSLIGAFPNCGGWRFWLVVVEAPAGLVADVWSPALFAIENFLVVHCSSVYFAALVSPAALASQPITLGTGSPARLAPS